MIISFSFLDQVIFAASVLIDSFSDISQHHKRHVSLLAKVFLMKKLALVLSRRH
jgi:hypothetical protein